MHAFDVLGDPVRRRILELLADGEQPSGAVTDVIRAEFGISQPAVSQHLKVLRDNGFATVRPDGARRLYAVDDDRAARGRRLARPIPPVLDAAPGRDWPPRWRAANDSGDWPPTDHDYSGAHR